MLRVKIHYFLAYGRGKLTDNKIGQLFGLHN